MKWLMTPDTAQIAQQKVPSEYRFFDAARFGLFMGTAECRFGARIFRFLSACHKRTAWDSFPSRSQMGGLPKAVGFRSRR